MDYPLLLLHLNQFVYRTQSVWSFRTRSLWCPARTVRTADRQAPARDRRRRPVWVRRAEPHPGDSGSRAPGHRCQGSRCARGLWSCRFLVCSPGRSGCTAGVRDGQRREEFRYHDQGLDGASPHPAIWSSPGHPRRTHYYRGRGISPLPGIHRRPREEPRSPRGGHPGATMDRCAGLYL